MFDAGLAATLMKGAHVRVEGELRSRQYEKDGLTRKILECRVDSILRLDRAVRAGRAAERGRL
jgi:single-strand DNA-binding protein